MAVEVGQMVPNFGVSSWVQGAPANFDQERDHIVVLEVFQVNCPGCFCMPYLTRYACTTGTRTTG